MGVEVEKVVVMVCVFGFRTQKREKTQRITGARIPPRRDLNVQQGSSQLDGFSIHK
jgi:hypothetical protein